MMQANNIPNTVSDVEIGNWKRMLNVLRFLRSKNGCPWDKEQTVQSLRSNLIEESSELLDAINVFTPNKNEHTHAHLKEEFGDVLLVTTMMMILYEEEASHAISHVYREITDKIIRRHPHVFADTAIESPDALSKQWHAIKKEQEQKKNVPLNTHKHYMHVLERAQEIQKKIERDAPLAKKTLFQEKRTAIIQLLERAHDLETQLPENAYQPPAEHIESTIGHALFMLVDMARSLRVNPTAALSYYIEKFIAQHTHDDYDVFDIPMGTQAIIFDLDGTLIHSEPKHILAWDKVMKASGKHFTDEMYASLNGLTSEGFATQLKIRYGVPFSVKEMIEQKNQYYLDLMPQVPFHEKTVHTLRRHYGRIPTALGTNEQKSVTYATLELKGLKNLFSTIITSEDVERSKPHPDIFLACAKNMHVDPKDCHVFEDSRVGIEAATSAGMSVTDVSREVQAC